MSTSTHNMQNNMIWIFRFFSLSYVCTHKSDNKWAHVLTICKI